MARCNNKTQEDSMTPLADHDKCIPSRKRQRQQDLHARSRRDARGSLKFPCAISSPRGDDASSDDVALFDASESDLDDERFCDEDDEDHEQLSHEVLGLQNAVSRMQSQVDAASAQLQELHALVSTLIQRRTAVRQQQQQQQALKKRRVVEA